MVNLRYQDAQCEFPERLVAEWLVEAIEAGAIARNHTQVLAVDVRQGRVKGIFIRDLLSGKEGRVEGSWIINATGPWADRICQRSASELRARCWVEFAARISCYRDFPECPIPQCIRRLRMDARFSYSVEPANSCWHYGSRRPRRSGESSAIGRGS